MEQFNRIIGMEKIKAKLMPILQSVLKPDHFRKLGVVSPKGLLLYGRPGTGKTTLCEAFIEASGLPSFPLKQEGTKDDFLRLAKEAFEKAAEASPSIVFIDDIDKAIDGKRGDDFRPFHVIQSLMDSVKEKEVFVIATANDIREIPNSLLRKGRIDFKIHVGAPSPEDVRLLTAHFLEGKPFAEDVDLNDIACMVDFTNVASIQSFINDCAIFAAYDNQDEIGIRHAVQAFLESSNIKDEWENEGRKKEVAIHEAGHLLVSEVCQPDSVGFVALNHSEMNGLTSMRTEILRRPYATLVALAGKAAYEQKTGKLASGCLSDLCRTTSCLRDGIDGSGTLGLSTSIRGDKREIALLAGFEAERFMLKAREIISSNLGFLDAAAEKLYQQGYLLYSDIAQLKKEHPLECTMILGI